MSISQPEPATNRPGAYDPQQNKSWTELGQDLWAYLTGRGAAINYSFVDMLIEVPRDTGQDAPRATWKLNGTLRITTSDDEFSGADPHRG
jgi:hypothetical protein